MGVSMSTLGGWAVIAALLGYVVHRGWAKNQKRQLAKSEGQRLKKDRQIPSLKKENKEAKPKRQRIEDAQRESYASKLKSAPPAPSHQPSYSSDDEVDNREFARQLSSVTQGTKFTKPKDESRQKSVKQSQAQELPERTEAARVSAPSSTAGIDADDDRSSVASPVVGAVGAGAVDDMLEKSAPGPTVLRLTDTTEKKPKEKKAKAPESVESKKQRQNRKKAEATKALREESERDRKLKLEAQRRLARESEGRAAKDGSAFTAAQTGPKAWTGNGINGKANGEPSTNGYLPVQPLDTFDSNGVHTDASKSTSAEKTEGWMSSLPSEEEQMEMLRKEETEAWSTVKTKPRKSKKKEASGDEAIAATPQPVAPAPSTPPAKISQKKLANNRPTKTFTQQSSFAALSTDSPPGQDEEKEWDLGE